MTANYPSTASIRSSRSSAVRTSASVPGWSFSRSKSVMYAPLLSNPALAACSTSKASAPSKAARLPACLSNRPISLIAIVPVPPVNLPESIVHGAMPLPTTKAGFCLDVRSVMGKERFQ